MSELGRLLYEARTAKGTSLADVEAVTRIRQKYLQALENGEYAKLPRGAVARGFLRTYAAYLGLDIDATLRRYIEESGDASEAVSIAEPGKPRLVDYRPLEVTLTAEQPRTNWWPWLAALVILVALGASGWWFLNRNPGWNPLNAFGPTPTVTNTATRWVVTATPRPTHTPTETLATPTSALFTLPTPTVPASPTPTPRPTATPEVVTRISMEVRTTQRTWLRVVVDGQTPEEGTLDANQSRTWEADKSIVIRTGNAGGVILILNGENLGAMGGIGQVAERAWIVNQGEVTETTTETATPAATPTTTPSG